MAQIDGPEAHGRVELPAGAGAGQGQAGRFPGPVEAGDEIRGRKGVSPGTDTTQAVSGRWAAAQSRAARIPASGPGWPGRGSGTTGRRASPKRAGSPLTFRTRPLHCGPRRSATRSRRVRPSSLRSGLSPPPMRRARPPARMTPRVGGAGGGIAYSMTMRGAGRAAAPPERAVQTCCAMAR
jgi:hypothetical protein